MKINRALQVPFIFLNFCSFSFLYLTKTLQVQCCSKDEKTIEIVNNVYGKSVSFQTEERSVVYATLLSFMSSRHSKSSPLLIHPVLSSFSLFPLLS